MTRLRANVIAGRMPPMAPHAVRTDPAVSAAQLSDAVHAMITSCERYAAVYAGLRRQPIGCDAARGPILLDVLRGIAALAEDGAQRDEVFEVISDHALDLEE